MKFLLRATVALFILGSLVACAGAGSKMVRAKCPACGYPFTVDKSG